LPTAPNKIQHITG